MLWKEQSGLLLPVIHLLLFFIGILQRSRGASALFECQQLRWKETAGPTELCTVCPHDYDGSSSASAHLWMLQAPFILSACSGSRAVTKNTEMLKYFSLFHMEEMDEETEFNTLKLVPPLRRYNPSNSTFTRKFIWNFRSLSSHVLMRPRPCTAWPQSAFIDNFL